MARVITTKSNGSNSPFAVNQRLAQLTRINDPAWLIKERVARILPENPMRLPHSNSVIVFR